MAEHTASTSRTLLTYILNFQWILKTHASLPPRLIMASTVTSMTQILHRLHSLVLLLPLFLTLKRLRSHGTPRMGHILLKLTNHSLRSPGIHVTFSQTLSQPSPLFVPDSQADSSQELSQGTNHRYYTCAPQTSRDLRL